MKNFAMLFFLVAGAVNAAGNEAQAEFLSVSSLFMQMDADKNGAISRTEINQQSLLATQFDTVDSNRDGELDEKEFEFFIATTDL